MSIVLGVIAGVGLSAACGLRVFLPMFLLGLGTASGRLPAAESWAWLGSTPALVVLGVATTAEVLGYLVPWVDHLLDGISLPMATAAGTLLTAGYLGDLDPTLRWTLGLIAGGGTAGGVRAGLTTIRAASTATTGGVGNPIVGLIEGVGSAIMTVLAVLAPLVALAVLVAFVYAMARLARRLRRALGLGVVSTPTEPAAR